MRHKIIVRLWLQRMVSYSIVLLGFCAVLFPLYSLMRQQTERALLTDASEKLAVSANTLQSYVRDIQYASNKLFSDDVYKQLSTNDDEMLAGNANLMYKASGRLQDLTFNMSYSAYCYVTFTRNSAVIDDYRFFSNYDDFYPRAFEYKGMPLEEWVGLQYPVSTTFLPARTLILNKTAYPSDYVTVQQPFVSTSGIVRGCFTVAMSVKTLSALFLGEDYQTGDSLFYMLQDDDTMLARYNYPSDSALTAKPESQSALQTYDGKKYYVVSRAIPNLGLKAVIGIPYARYVDSLREVDRAIVLYLIVGVVTGLLLSLMIAANDMRKLRPFLNQLSGESNTGRVDMYKLIASQTGNYKQLIEQLTQLRAQMEHGRIEELLKNGFILNDVQRLQIREQLRLKAYNFLMLISPSGNGQDGSTGNEMDLMMVANQLRSCSTEDAFTYRTAEGLIIVVLALESYTEEDQRRIDAKIKELHTVLGMESPVIMSACFSEVSELSEIYWRARNMVYYADKGQYLCRLSADKQDMEMTVNVTHLSRLNEYLLAGCMTEAQGLIKDLFPIELLSPQNFQQAFYSIRGVLLNCAQKVGCESIDHLCEWDNQLSAHKHVENLQDCCFEICNHVDATKRSHNDALQKAILTWLEENYHQPKLNLAMTAVQFNISQKYVSQFIRDQTGRSYTEYVESIRLAKALEMLKTTQISLAEISTRCGFSTQNTFYKAFKRRFNVSPSSIRRAD